MSGNFQARGVVFDLDGTLYRMPWYFRPVLCVRLVPHGMRLPAYMQVRAEVAGVDFGDGGALMADLCRRVGERLRIGEESARRWIFDEFYPAFVKSIAVLRDSRPGVGDLLASLRSRSIRTAVLSDFGCVAERLGALGIEPSGFDLLLSSEDRGALKPHPRPFLDIARAWGLDPGQILMVGDRADTDGAGAASAGMRFLHLVGAPSTDPACCTWPELRERLGALTP